MRAEHYYKGCLIQLRPGEGTNDAEVQEVFEITGWGKAIGGGRQSRLSSHSDSERVLMSANKHPPLEIAVWQYPEVLPS